MIQSNNIHFQHVKFLNRLFKDISKPPLLFLFLSITLLLIININLILNIFCSIILIIVLRKIYVRNIYYTEVIQIIDSNVKIVAYKYDNIYIDEITKIENINFKRIIISQSKRGVEVKLKIKFKNEIYFQYTILDWDDELFKKLEKLITGNGNIVA